MDLTIGPDEQQVIDSAAQLLAVHFPVSRLHRDAPHADGDRRHYLAEAGWFAIALPGRLGGLGMSPVEEALVFREIGRALGPTAVLPTSLAVGIAAEAGLDHLRDRLMSGEAPVALAVSAPGAAADTCWLFDIEGAAHAVRVDAEGAELFALDKESIAARPCLDKSIPFARGDLDGTGRLARIAGPHVYRRALLGIAAMQAGTAEAARDMIVDYAKIRTTFGRPIGAYQAVRHPCADMAVRSEAANAILFQAAVASRDGMEDSDLVAEAARVVASDAAVRNSDDSIQLHGAVGITDEHDAHLFMKRAEVVSRWPASERCALDRIAALSTAQRGAC